MDTLLQGRRASIASRIPPRPRGTSVPADHRAAQPAVFTADGRAAIVAGLNPDNEVTSARSA
jgi:hypothetical protein